MEGVFLRYRRGASIDNMNVTREGDRISGQWRMNE